MYKNQYKPFETEDDAALYLDNYIELKQYAVFSNQNLAKLREQFPELDIVDSKSHDLDDRVSQLEFNEGNKEDFMKHYDAGEVIIFERLEDTDPLKTEQDESSEKQTNVKPRDEYDTEIVDTNTGSRSMMEVKNNDPSNTDRRDGEAAYFRKSDQEEEEFLKDK